MFPTQLHSYTEPDEGDDASAIVSNIRRRIQTDPSSFNSNLSLSNRALQNQSLPIKNNNHIISKSSGEIDNLGLASPARMNRSCSDVLVPNSRKSTNNKTGNNGNNSDSSNNHSSNENRNVTTSFNFRDIDGSSNNNNRNNNNNRPVFEICRTEFEFGTYCIGKSGTCKVMKYILLDFNSNVEVIELSYEHGEIKENDLFIQFYGRDESTTTREIAAGLELTRNRYSPNGGAQYGIFLNTFGASVFTYNSATLNTKISGMTGMSNSMKEYARMIEAKDENIIENPFSAPVNAGELCVSTTDDDLKAPTRGGNIVTGALVACDILARHFLFVSVFIFLNGVCFFCFVFFFSSWFCFFGFVFSVVFRHMNDWFLVDVQIFLFVVNCFCSFVFFFFFCYFLCCDCIC